MPSEADTCRKFVIPALQAAGCTLVGMSNAMLAEELLEEWLYWQRCLTMRGFKIGVAEMGLLPVRMAADRNVRRRVAVCACVNPISYLCGPPKAMHKASGRGRFSAAKRTPTEIRATVRSWLHKQLGRPPEHAVQPRLCPGKWSRDLVVNAVQYPKDTTPGTDLVGLLFTPGLYSTPQRAAAAVKD